MLHWPDPGYKYAYTPADFLIHDKALQCSSNDRTFLREKLAGLCRLNPKKQKGRGLATILRWSRF